MAELHLTLPPYCPAISFSDFNVDFLILLTSLKKNLEEKITVS